MDQTALIVFAALTFLVAGTIKGAIGIGLPTVSISILSQGIDAKAAISLVVFPMLVSNAWQVYRSGETRRAIGDYWIFGAALIVVLWFTTSLTASVSSRAVMLMIGISVILFSVTNLLIHPPRLPDRYDKAAQIAGGGVAGLLGGLTSIWAPPVVIYLVARRMEKDEFIRATGLLIFIGSLPLLLGFWYHGLIDRPAALLSAAMVIPALAGFRIGESIRARLPVAKFHTGLLLFFLLMGLNAVRKAVMG